MSSNHPSAVPDTSYARPVAADALSDAVLPIAASPIGQAVTDSTQVPQPPVPLRPPKAKSTKPTSNPNYQTRWECEKAKAIQNGIDIEHTGGRRGTGDPQMIGPWVIGEMLGKGASGMWSSRYVCVVLDGIGSVLAAEERHILLLSLVLDKVDSKFGATRSIKCRTFSPAILLPFHRC